MAEVSRPDYTYQWSSGGAIVAPSNAKIQTGWTAEVPPFQWENWSQNRQDNALVHLFQKGISTWSSTQDYYFTTNGARSYVQASDGKIYVALQNSTNQNPVSSPTYWKLAFASSDLATSVAAGIVELATDAEMSVGTSTTLVPPVSAVMSLFSKLSFGVKDYIRIPDRPGGFILQFGNITNAAGAPKSEVFVMPFPNACRAVVLTGLQGTGNQQAYSTLNSTNLNGFVWTGFAANTGAVPVVATTIGQVQGFYIAVGN